MAGSKLLCPQLSRHVVLLGFTEGGVCATGQPSALVKAVEGSKASQVSGVFCPWKPLGPKGQWPWCSNHHGRPLRSGLHPGRRQALKHSGCPQLQLGSPGSHPPCSCTAGTQTGSGHQPPPGCQGPEQRTHAPREAQAHLPPARTPLPDGPHWVRPRWEAVQQRASRAHPSQAGKSQWQGGVRDNALTTNHALPALTVHPVL